MTRSTGGDKTHLKEEGMETEGKEEGKKEKEMEQTSGFLRRWGMPSACFLNTEMQ